MRKIYCDNHPDREAVSTIAFAIFNPQKFQPVFLAFVNPRFKKDLCSECLEPLRDESQK